MRRFLLLIILVAIEHCSFAYNFSAVAPSGQTLYYNIVGGNAQVTHPCNYYFDHISHVEEYWYGITKPTGNLSIPCSVSIGGHIYLVTSIDENAFYNCSGLTSVTIPDSITTIGEAAFFQCSGLTSVTIPSSVTLIGNRAFCRCSGLTSITIPNSVTSIGVSAFNNCSGLTSVTIPSSVTSIGRLAFSNCSGLTSIIVSNGNNTYDSRNNCNAIIHSSTDTLLCGCRNTVIPSSVTSIGDGAFAGCSGLTAITIPSSVTSIGQTAFANCSGLSSISIPSSVTSIGGWAFYECSGLTSIDIPNTITSIGTNTFYNCSGLTNITIPSSISSIGNHAFAGCNGLTSIIMKCNPPEIQSNTFDSIPINIPITIPCGVLTSYQTAQHWSNFTNFIEGCVTITVTTNDFTLGGVTGGGTYTTGDTVTLTAIPFSDSHFVGWSNGSQINPLVFIATTNASYVAAFAVDSLPQDTVYIHDTTYITLENHDTVFVNHYVHDTLINYIHDTTFINNYIHDTLFYPVYIHDTTIVNHFVYDTVYLEIYIHDTVYHDRYIHDTIYVHDTIYLGGEGIDNIVLLNAKIYQRNGCIVVEGAEGNPVYFYDVVGRLLATKRETVQEVLLDVPASGAYLVKIGDAPARRIVVRR